MSTLRFAPGVVMLLVAIAPAAAGAQTNPIATTVQATFSYPLRGNESLGDVSRIFGVPVSELIARNRISDPNRLRIGQILEIPDAYATEAASLRVERDQLAKSKREAERQSSARQTAIASLTDEIGKLEREKEILNGEIAAAIRWQQGAKILALLFLAAVAWTLKLAADRATLGRRVRILSAENGALATAKQKYRDAVGQLELRFQQLYGGRKGGAHVSSREAIDEGVTRLRRAFTDGTREIERLVTSVKLEREREEQIRDSESRRFAWLAHPVRDMLARKEHTP